MADNENSENLDKYRIKYNFYAVLAAFILIGVIFILAIFTTDAKDVPNVLGALTGIVGTIIGAFFGFAVGSEGKQDAIKTRDNAIEEKNTAIEQRDNAIDERDSAIEERFNAINELNELRR